jgi:hypothetical protein
VSNRLAYWPESFTRMVLIRSAIAGDTDYTGTTLEDLQRNLFDWRNDTEVTIDELYMLRDQVIENSGRIDRSENVLEFIDLIAEGLEKILVDLERLIEELPVSVEPRHPELVKQLASLGKELEAVCLDFKYEHINKSLKDEDLRFLLDGVYKQPRSQLLDYRDLSNLAYRLKTFVGTRPITGNISIDDVDVFELKPNVCGFGINLNHVIKRALNLWRARSSRKPQNQEISHR